MESYNNLIIARTRTGKTTLLYNRIWDIIDNSNSLENIFIFSSTLNVDKTAGPELKDLRKYCIKHKIDLYEYNGIKSLQKDGEIIDNFQEAFHIIVPDIGEEKKEEKKGGMRLLEHMLKIKNGEVSLRAPIKDNTLYGIEKKAAKRGNQVKHIMICDDVAGELKDKHINNFMKKSRHFNCVIYVSSQSPNDIDKEAWQNYNTIYLGYGLALDYIEKVPGRIGLNINKKDMLLAYNRVQLYQFLKIDKLYDALSIVMVK